MGNRFYSVGRAVGAPVEPIKTHGVYFDIDTISMYQDSENTRYCEDLTDFIKILVENAGIEYNDACRAKVVNLANALSKYSVDVVIQQLSGIFSELFGQYYTYDELLEYYNQTIREKEYVMKKLVDANAVRNSIHQIFSWTPGERILNPEFGSKLRLLLYEQITDENQERIIAEVKQCITKWEPRVQITDLRKITTVEDVEENTVNIQIKYRIIGLDDEEYSYVYSSDVFNQ